MSVVGDIKARLDIVDVVSGYVALKKSGRYMKAACPFHSEKTPSFIVDPERESWRCFGACATGGDVFSFVMRSEGLDFAGALRLLAAKAGVSLSTGRESGRDDGLYRINQVAASFYRDVLESSRGKHAIDYLDRRGVSGDARSRFELGLSPDGWDGLKSHLVALGLAEDQAVDAGLLRRGDGGNTWDFFKGRLMFPIHDRHGRVAGFGARALDDSMPKYINTAKTPVFDKRGTLYALHMAAESIREQGTGVVVEGYMDVVAAHQHGYTNVVASMGTALTEQQVSQLRSLARAFVLALDPDSAGEEATPRSLESSWQIFKRLEARGARGAMGPLYRREPWTYKLAKLPGRDPDVLIREDPGQWERLISEAPPLVDYLINLVADRFDLSSGQGKAQAVEAVFPIIAADENPFEQERHFRKLAEVLGVSESSLKASIGRRRPSRRADARRSDSKRAPEVSASALAASPEDALEDYILALLLQRPELRERVMTFEAECFRKTAAREVFTRWLRCSTMDDLKESLNEPLREHLAYLAGRELVPLDRRQGEIALTECLQRLERRHLQELQEGMLASEETSVPPAREVEKPVSDVNARIRELDSQRAR